MDTGAGPEGYVNRYGNAWATATQQINATIEEIKRRRHRGGLWVPTGTCGRLTVETLPAGLQLPSRSWPPLRGRPPGAAAPCGACKHCLRPSLKADCLSPVPMSSEEYAASTAKCDLCLQAAACCRSWRSCAAAAAPNASPPALHFHTPPAPPPLPAPGWASS